MPIVLGRKGSGGGGSAAPSGPAGGDLSGTYPNPDIAAGSVGTPELSTAVALQLTDGWVDDTAATWTRTGNQTFTVTGDRTAVFSKGTRIKVTDGTVKYFVVVASAFGAVTTVTITGGSDYVLAANPTARAYSYAANPQGFPTYFNYTPVLTGSGGNPTLGSGSSSVGTFQVVGGVVTVLIRIQVGTSGYSNGTGDVIVSIPVDVIAAFSGGVMPSGSSFFYDDSGADTYLSGGFFASASTSKWRVHSTVTPLLTYTSPVAWANSDVFNATLTYLL